jgi:hypothetical protein
LFYDNVDEMMREIRIHIRKPRRAKLLLSAKRGGFPNLSLLTERERRSFPFTFLPSSNFKFKLNDIHSSLETRQGKAYKDIL